LIWGADDIVEHKILLVGWGANDIVEDKNLQVDRGLMILLSTKLFKI
jgi:hypothetical protein